MVAKGCPGDACREPSDMSMSESPDGLLDSVPAAESGELVAYPAEAVSA